jgi:hypothetical protein
MTTIREPYVEIDLTVQYSSIDLRPEPNTPIVGIVLRSDYYADYYYSLPERERVVNRRAIEINSKRDYLTKIVRGNYILPSDHLSLKNGYYIAGSVRLYVAPEIPTPSYANQDYGWSGGYPNNVKFAATFFTTTVRSKLNPQLNQDIMGFWINNSDDVSIWFGSPIFKGLFNGRLSISGSRPMLTVTVGSSSHSVAFIGINDNVYPIRTAALVEFYTRPQMFEDTPHILVLTDEYLFFFQAIDNTGSNYKVLVLAKINQDLSQLRDAMMSIQRIKFYKDTTPETITPVDIGISISFSPDSTSLGTFDALFSSDPSTYYYHLSYIVANPTLNGTYDYNNLLYGYMYSDNASGAYYPVDHIIVMCDKDDTSVYWLVSAYDYDGASGNFLSTTTVNPCGAISFSGSISHNVSLTNTISGCDISVPNASVVSISYAAAIGRVKHLVKYKIGYAYTPNSFSEALELLNMADLITDNGYCATRVDYPRYANQIAEFAARIDVDKVPALAVINLPFNIGASVAANNIRPTVASSTFLCAGYFRNESLGYPTMLPVSSLYVQRVVSMYSILNAFSPIYNRPLIPLSPIDRIYSEREREILLSKRINSLRPYEGAWAFNNNLTATLDNSIFKEENIRRLANTVARELMQLLKKFLGMQNTDKTRAQVVSLIKRMKEVIIDPHEYKPDEFIIICDETNNRDFDRYLYVTIIVRMPLSIKYIELVTVAIDLEMA